MVTGIEAAGLALAILPLFVNQIDSYVRGIERIKAMRRYRREFKGYSVGIKTQYAILLNTLEQVLEGVVNDEDKVSELIRDTKGDGWKDPDLQRRLRLKLNRDYDVYIANILSLSEMLERLSYKLESGISDPNLSPIAEAWSIWKFRKILNRAVYDDLLAKISEINTVLKTLIDQSDHRENTRKKRQTWHHLLKRLQKARKHAQGLFKTIAGGTYWHCQCKEQHCVHLKLQTNPLGSHEEYPGRDIDGQFQFRMIFSNAKQASPTYKWAWTEVVFEPWRVGEVIKLASMSLHEDSMSLQEKRPKVQFNIPEVDEMHSLENEKEAPPVEDFCTSLCVAWSDDALRTCIGSISNSLDSSVKYTMHAVKTLPTPPQRSLREVLSQTSRQDRLRIATGLACGVIQFHDNWLKARWDSSDVYLAASSDGSNMVLDNIYLSCSLPTADRLVGTRDFTEYSNQGNSRLLPLGLALVELSVGKSLNKLIDPEDGNVDQAVTKFATASKLVEMVYKESGTNYAEAVHSCLSWSALCLEAHFEERIFDTIVSPLLRDLVNF